MIKKSRRPLQEINSSSMADIAFLLLIFFLVTTPISMDRGINVVLPAGDSKKKVLQKDLTTIIVDDSGEAIFKDPRAPIDTMNDNQLYMIKSLAITALQKNKNMIFTVEVTPKSEYVNYIKVLDYLKQANAKKIAIAN